MTKAPSPNPLRLEGELDPRLSRWLWLVKWVLVIPHLIVLVFLWIAFIVLWLVALVAILFTGRYPRSIFEFNVGVLRWSWRVGFYSYSALGTDRYPPFTLADVADYPARLTVEYPPALSRGLALVKWWLLALPQYLVVGVFAGGAWAGANAAGDDWAWTSGSGLIGLLVCIAGIALLFTGRYPQSDLRLRHGHEPLVLPRRRLRRADDRQVPALPPGHGWPRAGPRHDHVRRDHTEPGPGALMTDALRDPSLLQGPARPNGAAPVELDASPDTRARQIFPGLAMPLLFGLGWCASTSIGVSVDATKAPQ